MCAWAYQVHMLKSLTDNLWQPGAVLGMFGLWLSLIRSYKLRSFLVLLRTIKFSACGRSHSKMERSRQFLLKLELVSVRSHPKMNWSQPFLLLLECSWGHCPFQPLLECVPDKYDLTQKLTDLINFIELISGNDPSVQTGVVQSGGGPVIMEAC